MSGGNKKIPFKRHFISLEQKLQILDRLEKGEKVSYVAKTLDLNEATIRTIQKNEHKIRASIAAGCSISANLTSRPRAPIIEKMEKALSIWIDDCSKNQIPLDTNIIKQKALKIYNYLKENGESAVNPDFVASKGWFDRFRKRFSLQNLKIQGKSASADKEAAKIYPKELQEIIEQRGYSRHRVFNADETCHWWEKMPKKTFISKNEEVSPGFKASKDHITLLTCSNVTGDHMVKPMLVYKSLGPHAMKNINSGDNSTGENEEAKHLTLKSVKKGLDLAKQLELYFLTEDPSTERSTKFKRELHKCLAPYNEIYKDLSTKSKQSKITDFGQKVQNRSQDNAEESSEDGAILSKRKRPCIMVLSSDDEENII